MSTASKTIEHISGSVEQVNAKQTGIKVLGEWLNVSNFHPVAVMPTAGELVEVQIERTDKGAWINSLHIIPGSATMPAAHTSGRERSINKSVALKAAAAFAAGKCIAGTDVKSSDVLRIAEAWLDWLEEEAPTA